MNLPLLNFLIRFDFSVAHVNHAPGVLRDVRLVRHQNNCIALRVQALEHAS